jgi:Uma2 family endonuclease
METISTPEIVRRKSSAPQNGGIARRSKKTVISLEERTDLTISEVEALGITDPFELIDGRIIFKMANPIHAYFQIKLASKLDAYLEQNPIGALFDDLNLRLLPEDEGYLRRPDLAFYLNENRPKIDQPHTLAPDLAIEIVSEDSKLLEILKKKDLYLDKGSKVVWIVIPATACVWIWTASGERWEYETLTCPELLPAWSLDLKKLFAAISEFEPAN